ncbi:hypothetical protein TRFO_30004 [Tritrichomonas foetus]|uniref:Uncharacterized protein n=1 Tax=Tritrichomonas foetus TaxID=1144522 RepID=A0A1J4JUD2_9EUKA|nr:hypothetical protein TRFO_30004 [Tritrichomonas foetus]|eukprot:OHT02759.1 hypothetical protein TRFO_30004 [Tritrichomonas foetus]
MAMTLSLPLSMMTVNDDEDFTITRDELDMSSYQAKLQHQRDENSLYLRRLTVPGIKIPTCKTSLHSNDISSNFINKEQVISNLISCDSESVLSLQGFPKLCSKYLTQAAASEEFINALVESISDSEKFNRLNNEAKALLFGILASVFPYCNEQTIERIVDDVSFMISDILSNNEDFSLYSIALNIATVFSQESEYARDSLTCLGIHMQIIEIASKHISEEITELCLITVFSIYRNDGPMNSYTITEAIDPLYDILSKSSQNNVLTILNTFSEMTNKLPEIIPVFFTRGLYQYALQSLGNPIMTKVSLNLIGNMCISRPSFMETLIKEGLFEKIMNVIQSNKEVADAFWVISNLIESIPHLMEPLISCEFINFSLNIADQAPFNTKREIAYFISTYILFMEPKKLTEIINEKLICLISEMLESGISNIILRSIDAFYKLITIANTTGQFPFLLSLLVDCDVKSQLEENMEQFTDERIPEKANCLIWQIEQLSHECL